jgi:hypothetical protein
MWATHGALDRFLACQGSVTTEQGTVCAVQGYGGRFSGSNRVTVEGFEYEGDGDEEVLVFAVCPTRGRRGQCSRSDRKCRGYDQGGGRWRSLDLGTTRVFLEADAPRVRCPEHGVVVAAVPWARPGSRFTAAFEDMLCVADRPHHGDGGLRTAAHHLAVGLGGCR